MRVVRASDVAKLIATPVQGSETSLKFGKIFEECYTFATYLYDRTYMSKSINAKFIRKVAFELKKNGIYSSENIRKAYRMYSSLLNAGIIGAKPKTVFRKVENYDDLMICAQPDLWDYLRYYEFKTYAINDYAIAQCKIFSWVLQEPVILVGLKVRPDGFIVVEKKEISIDPTFQLPDIPDHMGNIEDLEEEYFEDDTDI